MLYSIGQCRGLSQKYWHALESPACDCQHMIDTGMVSEGEAADEVASEWGHAAGSVLDAARSSAFGLEEGARPQRAGRLLTQAAASYSAHSLKEAVEVLPPGEGQGVVGAEPGVAPKQGHPQDSKDEPEEQQEQHHVLDGSETLQGSSSTVSMELRFDGRTLWDRQTAAGWWAEE